MPPSAPSAPSAPYEAPGCRPSAFISPVSSSLSPTLRIDVSRTLSGLPRSGKTPNVSRPTTARPATARALAESPSVTMSVHSDACAPPASSASSSLGTSIIVEPDDDVRRASARCSRCERSAATASSSPGSEATPLTKPRGRSHAPPKRPAGVVSASFDCESNSGLSTLQSTKSIRCCLIRDGGIGSSAAEPRPSARERSGATSFNRAAATWLTWVPPRGVATPLTNAYNWKDNKGPV